MREHQMGVSLLERQDRPVSRESVRVQRLSGG